MNNGAFRISNFHESIMIMRKSHCLPRRCNLLPLLYREILPRDFNDIPAKIILAHQLWDMELFS